RTGGRRHCRTRGTVRRLHRGQRSCRRRPARALLRGHGQPALGRDCPAAVPPVRLGRRGRSRTRAHRTARAGDGNRDPRPYTGGRMSLQPDALVLLDAVSRTLGREVAPTLSGSDRYQVLLAANAVAMARRELAADERILAAETRAMAELLGDEIDGGGDIVKRHALLATSLAEAIRARRFDEPERQDALLD